MAEDLELAADLAEDYTRSELLRSRKVLAQALIAPDSITSQDTEGLAFTVNVKNPSEIRRTIALIRAALVIQDNPDPAVPDADTMSSSFDFSTRRIE